MAQRLVYSEGNSYRIRMVEKCFGSSGKPLAAPGRILVGEAVLTKVCRKKHKERQFFLFNDILVYGNILINKMKYNKQHVIPLEEIKLESLEDKGEIKNGWIIKTKSKSFAVYAPTPQDKEEWILQITNCIMNLKKSGKKAAESHAPVWIPDSEAKCCMHCKRTKFTIINRRHHCRSCGKVICGTCSNEMLVLPNQPDKKERVCPSCFQAGRGIQFKKYSSLKYGSNERFDFDEYSDDDSELVPNSIYNHGQIIDHLKDLYK